jgi:hypothetical protein
MASRPPKVTALGPEAVVLPKALPVTLEAVKAFASSLGLAFDAKNLADEGPFPLDGSASLPDSLLANGLAETDRLRESGAKLDLRRFQPFSGLTSLGADGSGDGFYLDGRLRTVAGTAPLLRFCHDQALTAVLEANGVHEWAARGLLTRWATAHSQLASKAVQRLLHAKVKLDEVSLKRTALNGSKA